MSNTTCPVSGEKTDNNKARIFSVLVIITVGAYIFTEGKLWILFLNIDFFLRAFLSPKDSISKYLVNFISEKLKINERLTDAAPKKFAAKIGYAFTTFILLLAIFGFKDISMIISYILIFFASLEAFIGFCTGCFIYNLFFKVFPDYKK